MNEYPARFVKEEDGKFSVFFLGKGMEGCITYGNDRDDARKNAQEALDAYIGYLYSERKRIPAPVSVSGDGIEYFTPDYRIQFAITLRKNREKRHITQSDMAFRMGILPAQYQRLENPKKTNPTLETIHRIEEALGDSVFLRF